MKSWSISTKKIQWSSVLLFIEKESENEELMFFPIEDRNKKIISQDQDAGPLEVLFPNLVLQMLEFLLSLGEARLRRDKQLEEYGNLP